MPDRSRTVLPLIVDSAFATPALLRPLEYGADIVVHSLTKWLGGHGSAIGGIVVDSGKFDWSGSRFALFNEPDANYHGLVWTKDLGPLTPLACILRMRIVPLRNLGAAISPDNAWIFLQGIETLPLRMKQHSENALKVAEFLETHPKVAWVRHPALPSDPSHQLAKKYLPSGGGGMVVFGVKGGYDAAVKIIDNIDLFSHLANVGDAKSLVLHPASTSHSQLSPEQQ
jgi:O-acetylhomoserine (thiol)-lyase